MDEYNREPKKFTPAQATAKAEYYCAYQERSQQEVRDKLYGWGLHQEDVENIIARLIEENFLNEERFATAFTLGKFRLKGWGKVKIKQHLKIKRVSDPIIRKALLQIDEDDYLRTFQEAIDRKITKPINKLSLSEKGKLIRHLQSKGFENEMIFQKMHD